MSAHCITEPEELQPLDSTCVTTTDTVYVNGNDCGGSNTEGCVLGVTKKIAGAPNGDFLHHDATCYGRCDAGVSNGACNNGATPAVRNEHQSVLTDGIWVRVAPDVTAVRGRVSVFSPTTYRLRLASIGNNGGSGTHFTTIPVNAVVSLFRIEMTRSTTSKHGVYSIIATGA